MTARVTGVRVEGHRGIRQLDVELPPVTLLAGRSGAGKSALLDALDLLAESARGRLGTALAPARFSSSALQGPCSRTVLEARLIVEGIACAYTLELHAARDGSTYLVAAERLVWDRRVVLDAGSYLAGPETLLARASYLGTPGANLVRRALASFSIYPGRRPSSGPLAEGLESLRRRCPADWENLRAAAVRCFAPGELLDEPREGEVWRDPRDPEPRREEELPAGVRSFLRRAISLLSGGRRALYAVDDLEADQFPDQALAYLAGLARVRGAEGSTSLVTTRSGLVLSLAERPELEPAALRRTGEGCEIVRVDEDVRHWLDDPRDLLVQVASWGHDPLEVVP